MFIPFYNSCRRDFDLLEMSICYLRRLGDRIGPAIVTVDRSDGFRRPEIDRLTFLKCTILERPNKFGDWGWNSSLIGLTMIRRAVQAIADFGFRIADFCPAGPRWLLKIDSDTMILNGTALDAIAAMHGRADLVGFLQSDPPKTPRGPLLHCGGRCQFLSMTGAAAVAALTFEDATRMRAEMDSVKLCLFEDVVLSYAVMFTGGRVVGLDPHVHECWDGSAEETLLHGPRQGSVLHIDGYQGRFGPVASVRREQIPGLMREAGRHPEGKLKAES